MDEGERPGEERRCWESLCEAERLGMEVMWRRSIVVAIVLVVVLIVVTKAGVHPKSVYVGRHVIPSSSVLIR